MHCINCGAKLVDNANYCHLCGYKVSELIKNEWNKLILDRQVTNEQIYLDLETNSAYEGNQVEPVEIELSDNEEESDNSVYSTLDDLENTLFAESDDDFKLRASKKLDKFSDVYLKDKEFQKLLDEEYGKIEALREIGRTDKDT